MVAGGEVLAGAGNWGGGNDSGAHRGSVFVLRSTNACSTVKKRAGERRRRRLGHGGDGDGDAAAMNLASKRRQEVRCTMAKLMDKLKGCSGLTGDEERR